MWHQVSDVKFLRLGIVEEFVLIPIEFASEHVITSQCS
jgi:hypothetical protein